MFLKLDKRYPMKKIFLLCFFCISPILAQDSEAADRCSKINHYPNELANSDIEDEGPIPLQGDKFQSAFKKMLWMLFALIILVVLTVWMIKRLTNIRLHQNNRYSSIKILEKRNLSPKSILYIVDVDGKRILLSESQMEIRKLETLPTFTEPEEFPS